MKYLGILIAFVVASFTVFASEPQASAETSTVSAARDYIFTLLVLDDPDALSEDELKVAMQGHFSNMKVLAEGKKLLVAGPFGEPGISEKHRGIFVFNTGSVAEAKQWAGTDPSIQAGVFRPEFYVFRSPTPLVRLFELKAKRDRALEAIPEEERGFDGRAYVWAVGPANAEFADGAHVLIHGEMIAYQDGEPRLWLLVDAENTGDAQESLGLEVLTDWDLYGWYGSNVYADLAGVKVPTASP